VACAAAAVACGADTGDTTEGVVVTDSAGVRVVQNAAVEDDTGQRTGTRAWRVSAQPRLEIGAADETAGGEAYLFDRIMGVHRLSDGRWAVADMGSSQVRYFDADGAHLYSVGGGGDGPREFRQITRMQPLDGDRLAIDDAVWRVQLLDSGGGFVGTIEQRARPNSERTTLAGALADGTLIARTISATPQIINAPHTMKRSYHRARLETDPAGSMRLDVLQPIGEWDLVTLVPGWRGQAQPRQFERPVLSAIWSAGVVIGDASTGELRWYDADGGLRVVARQDRTPAPVTQAHIDALRSAFTASGGEDGRPVPPQLVRQREEVVAEWVFAEYLPAFHELRVDAADNVWARDYVVNEETVGSWHRAPVRPTGWTVFAPDGALIGRIELPARFAPLYFGEDIVAGIHRDDFDVEYVRVYGIERR
jgi:hypothetical protein